MKARFASWLGSVLVAGSFIAPAGAQDLASNPGHWWTAPAAARAPFAWFNPLSTIYVRAGMLFSRARDSTLTGPGFIDAHVDFGDSFGLVAGVGTRLMPVLRYELQVAGTNARRALLTFPGIPVSASTAVGNFQVMNNFYLDGAPLIGTTRFGINPYVFGGIGVSFNRMTDFVNTTPNILYGTGQTHVALAWNAGAGVQYQPYRFLILDLNYRYLDAGTIRSAALADGTPSSQTPYAAHQVMFSLIIPIDGLLRAP